MLSSTKAIAIRTRYVSLYWKNMSLKFIYEERIRLLTIKIEQLLKRYRHTAGNRRENQASSRSWRGVQRTILTVEFQIDRGGARERVENAPAEAESVDLVLELELRLLCSGPPIALERGDRREGGTIGALGGEDDEKEAAAGAGGMKCWRSDGISASLGSRSSWGGETWETKGPVWKR